MRLVLFLALISFACEQKSTSFETCSLQGVNHLKSNRISCIDPLLISQVEFSNGCSYKLIQGKIRLNNEKHSFTILTDSTKVVEHKFPLVDLDSSQYRCKINYTNSKIIEIEWFKKDRRLFLRKKLPE